MKVALTVEIKLLTGRDQSGQLEGETLNLLAMLHKTNEIQYIIQLARIYYCLCI